LFILVDGLSVRPLLCIIIFTTDRAPPFNITLEFLQAIDLNLSSASKNSQI
jgi:hypothetical protein